MRTLSNALFAGAAAALVGSAAAFAGLGPFAVAANPLAAPLTATSAPATLTPSAATPSPFVKVTGSGTIAFDLPARYGTGLTITDFYCQNTFLSGPGTPEEPAMGIRGLLAGHAYTALFSATRTSIAFENISATPAMTGGATSTYVPGQRVAGTVAIQTGPDTAGTSRQGSGTVTVDLTCVGGAAPQSVAPASASASVLATPATIEATSTPGPSPWGPGLALAAVAAVAGALVTRSRAAVPSAVAVGETPPWEPRTEWMPPLDYPLDDPDRDEKLRLDRLIADARYWMHSNEATPPETIGGDNSVRGGGCLNIFGNILPGLGSRLDDDPDRAYRHWRDEYEKLVEQRRSFEGFQPRPPENAPGADDGTDRQEIG